MLRKYPHGRPEVTLEEDVIMTVGDFNVQQNLIASAEEALDIAIMAY